MSKCELKQEIPNLLNMGKNQQQESLNVIIKILDAKGMPNTSFSCTSASVTLCNTYTRYMCMEFKVQKF